MAATRNLSELSDDELEELEDVLGERRQSTARATRQIRLPRIAPQISTFGPDPHVLAARSERAVSKAMKAASIRGGNARMSDADLDKLDRSNRGLSLQAETPGIDAYKSRNRYAGGTSVDLDLTRRSVAQISDEIRGNKAARPKDPYKPSVMDRVNSIAHTLKPGDYVGVKEGNSAARSKKLQDGTYSTEAITMPNRIGAGPGKVKDESGNMVPIREATAKLAAAREPTLAAADRAATETAATINHNRESNPAVALARKVSAYQASKRVTPRFSERPVSTVAGASRPAADMDPYRRRLVAVR